MHGTSTPVVLRPQLPRHHYVTARVIANDHLIPQQRAFYAAQWVAGTLTIQNRTRAPAAAIFKTSPSAVRRAAVLFGHVRTMSELETVWSRSTTLEREQFVRDHAEEVYALLDRATAPAEVAA